MRSLVLALVLVSSFAIFPGSTAAETCNPLETACADADWVADGLSYDCQETGALELFEENPLEVIKDPPSEVESCAHAEGYHSGVAIFKGVGKLYLGSMDSDPVGTCTFSGDGDCTTEGPTMAEGSCTAAFATTETETGFAADSAMSASDC